MRPVPSASASKLIKAGSMSPANVQSNSYNLSIVDNTSLVFAGKRSSLPSAVASTGTLVNHQPLLVCVKLNPSADIPRLHSVWVDLPRNGLGETGAIFSALATTVQTCYRFKRPIAVVRTDSNTIDGRTPDLYQNTAGS